MILRGVLQVQIHPSPIGRAAQPPQEVPLQRRLEEAGFCLGLGSGSQLDRARATGTRVRLGQRHVASHGRSGRSVETNGDGRKRTQVKTIVGTRGGSGWESNPPWLARRYPSTVLKTAEATRSQPPPRIRIILTLAAAVKGAVSPCPRETATRPRTGPRPPRVPSLPP